MTKIFASPGRYIQGYKEIEKLHRYIVNMGKRFLVVTSQGRSSAIKQTMEDALKNTECTLEFEIFKGECTRKEIFRIVDVINNKETKIDAVIGIGGGKVIDTAKGAAFFANLPIVIIPTIASNDAPTSSLSVIYSDEGTFEDVIFYHRSPEIVILDTNIIVHAPTRLLVAGMGDALATYIEARTCVEAYRDNFISVGTAGMFEGASNIKATNASYGLAKLCYEILLENGLQAKLSAEKKLVTKAFENIVEVNSLLSGIGFESNGVATAHAVYCGFSELQGREHMYHGEYVAFGTIVMLVLENRPKKEIDEAVKFCLSIGLPVTFEDMNLADITQAELDKVVEVASAPGQTSKVEPFEVTKEEMLAAIVTADEIGKLYKAGGSLI